MLTAPEVRSTAWLGGDKQEQTARSPWPSSAAGESVVHRARAAPAGGVTASVAAEVWCHG